MTAIAELIASSGNPWGLCIEQYGRALNQFWRDVLGIEPDKWQEDANRAISHGNTRIAIRSGHGVGKSLWLAALVVWFSCTRLPFKVGMTAPSSPQLHDALLGEIRALYRRLPLAWAMLFSVQSDRIELKSQPDNCFVSARTSRADNPESLQGLHSENLLLVIDEASGVPEAVFEAAVGSMSTPRAITVMTGNPTRATGMFWRAFNMEPDRWWLRKVSCHESPRVDPAFIEEVLSRWGPDSNQYRVRVLGEFPLAEDDTLIPAGLVESAMERVELPMVGAPEIWGVDVARFGCFDGETEILTDDGWKFFVDLTGAEQVLTLDGDEARWGVIEQIHRYPYVGPMNLFEGKAANFCITDNHNLLVRTGFNSSDYAIRRYDELPQDFQMRAWHSWAGGSSPETVEFTTEKAMPHGGVARYSHTFSSQDWAEFLGWFLSEGNVYTERRRSGRHRIMIAQNPGPKRQRIESLLTRMGIRWRVCSGTHQQVEFTSQAIGRHLLEHCGHGAANKRVPAYVRNGSQDCILAFLEAFRAGDGGERADGSGRVYRTTSQQMADDLQEMLAKVGRAGKLAVQRVAGSRARFGDRMITRTADHFELYERAPESWARGARSSNPHRDRNVRKRDVERIMYSGDVWCVSTPLRTIMVRRHGVTMWSGNSDQSVLIKRRGNRVTEPPRRWQGIDTMRLAGTIKGEFDLLPVPNRPQLIAVDVIGIGAGVVDRLLEQNLPVIGVNVGEAPPVAGRFMRLRDQLWLSVREWLETRAVSLPYDDQLRADLCAPRVTFLSDGRMQVESKQQLRARGFRSPDAADALCQTFVPSGMALQLGLGNLLNTRVPVRGPMRGME